MKCCIKRSEADAPEFPYTPAILGEPVGGQCVFGKAVTIAEDKDYGNALLSEYPIIKHDVIAIPNPKTPFGYAHGEPRSIIRARIDVDGTQITVLSTHYGTIVINGGNVTATAHSTDYGAGIVGSWASGNSGNYYNKRRHCQSIGGKNSECFRVGFALFSGGGFSSLFGQFSGVCFQAG